MEWECNAKLEACRGAVEELRDYIETARVIGVGTGSTVGHFIRLAADKGLLKGKKVVPSSIDTALRLRSMGVDVIMPHTIGSVDVYVDGADEVDPQGNLLKGGGGALLGEKILAYSSSLNIIVVDESKIVGRLGSRPVPIEVVPWGLQAVLSAIHSMGYDAEIRSSHGKMGPVVSDWGGIIVDVSTGPIDDPRGLDAKLNGIPGVVATGVFAGLTDYVSVGFARCGYRVIRYGRR